MGQAALHLERLWDRNIAITTRLVDAVSTPVLLEILRLGNFDRKPLIHPPLQLDHIADAFEAFGKAAETKALKVIIEA